MTDDKSNFVLNNNEFGHDGSCVLQNDRLFSKLRIKGGKRQFVISGEIEDYFMLNRFFGLANLETALEEYLKTRGFEIVITIKSLSNPEFLTPEMEQRFNDIVRGKSIDPQAKNAGKNTRAFIPRNKRGTQQNSTQQNSTQQNSTQQNSTQQNSAQQNSAESYSASGRNSVPSDSSLRSGDNANSPQNSNRQNNRSNSSFFSRLFDRSSNGSGSNNTQNSSENPERSSAPSGTVSDSPHSAASVNTSASSNSPDSIPSGSNPNANGPNANNRSGNAPNLKGAGANGTGANGAGANDQTRRAEQTAIEVTNAGNNSEQSFLDLLTRLFNSPVKSAVLFFHPENMWMSQPTENDLRKLETILRWATVTEGHPESASLLVINPSRLIEFNRIADLRLDRSNYTQNIELARPGKKEIESFLFRFACRYDFYGQFEKIAAAAYAKNLPLYNFSELLREFVRSNPHCKSLDAIFADSEQTKTLDELLAEINDLTGMDSLKKAVQTIIADANYAREQRRMGKETDSQNYHMLFLGNPGTGKTTAARLIGQLFWALELRQSQAFVEISYADIISSYNEGETVENMKNKIAEAAGGVLFIDEFYLFTENEWGKKAIETLMKIMDDNRNSFTVIFAGYEDKLPELYKINSGIKSRINRKVIFQDYSVDELVVMFERTACKKNHLILTDPARTKLIRYLDSFAKRGGIGNGRGIRNLFEKTISNRALRQATDPEILPGDLPDPIAFKQTEAKRLIDEFNSNFIGLPRVKSFFSKMFNRQLNLEAMGETVTGPNHCLFLGNPGTGKTSVARQMGKLFHALGIISEDKFLEVDPIGDLTSQYQSEYAQKVRDTFERALGGVLFIDEAYQLVTAEQGPKVIDQIVKLITEPTYSNLVVILAGYPENMNELLKINPGLKRRFPHEVFFDDFSPDELKEIFMRCMKKDGKAIAVADQDIFENRLLARLARMKNTRQFSNAGAVELFYRDIVKSNLATRLLRPSKPDTPEVNPKEFLAADLTGQEETSHETINDILNELDEKFIGMNSLKTKLRSLSTNIYASKKRAQASRAVSRSVVPDLFRPGQYNMRFVGNAGTGKTTIARYMARVFCSLGIIEHPQVKEFRGVDLKGSFVGQTKDKVNKIFESSEGCVIIIDEVYSLYNPDAITPDSYGLEAIDTLVGCITDPRNAATIIILAGYKDKMNAFLSANQGLASRFGTEIDFPDYSDQECAQILYNSMKNDALIWPDSDDFNNSTIHLFETIRAHSNGNFGNARTVENVFKQIMEKQAIRVSQMATQNDSDWLTILPEDLALFS